MSGEHFLDAAILIGKVVSWDAQNARVQAYFARSNARRHTSHHVARGARNTLLAIRRVFREYAVQLDHDVRGLDATRVHDELRRHLAKYIDARLSSGTINKNLAGQVRRIAQLFENKFRNVVMGSGRAEDAAYEVDRAIENALTDLTLLCNTATNAPVRAHACPQDVKTTYKAQHERAISQMGGHADDALVAVEALHIHKTIASALNVLVTTDREHFLNNKTELDKILAPLVILPPESC